MKKFIESVIIVAKIVLPLLFIAITLHEIAHLLVGLYVGAKVELLSIGIGEPSFRFMIGNIPFKITPWIIAGFVKFNTKFPLLDNFLVSPDLTGTIFILLSGVLTNFLLWLTFKNSSNSLLKTFSFINAELAVFNILPIAFTDGGRLTMTICYHILGIDPSDYKTVVVAISMLFLSAFIYVVFRLVNLSNKISFELNWSKFESTLDGDDDDYLIFIFAYFIHYEQKEVLEFRKVIFEKSQIYSTNQNKYKMSLIAIDYLNSHNQLDESHLTEYLYIMRSLYYTSNESRN